MKLFRWLSSSISKSFSLKHSDHLLHRKCNWLAKLIVCFLCLNVTIASTYHVVCNELKSEGISEVHYQLHHCNNFHDNESGKFIQSHNHKTSHAALLGSQSKAQSCPDCIDMHINFEAAGLFNIIFPPNIQSDIDQFLDAQINSSYVLPKKYIPPLISFRSSVIRSIVMLI